MLQARPLDVFRRVAETIDAAHIGVVAFLALRLQEALADMIVRAGALQILRAAGRVAFGHALAAAILDAARLARPFAEPGIVVADSVFEAQADAIDLADLGAAPGRHVEPDQQPVRPAVIVGKICERQFFQRHVLRLAVSVLVGPELGFRLEALALLLGADQAVLEIAAERRALGRLVPLRQPVAERIAEPRRLRPQRLEAELVPDRLARAPCIPASAARAAACRPSWSRPSAASNPLRCRARAWARGPGRDAAPAHVLDRVHAVGHRPEQRVGIVGGDVVVDRDADLAAVGLEEGGAVQRAPHLGARGALLQRDDE